MRFLSSPPQSRLRPPYRAFQQRVEQQTTSSYYHSSFVHLWVGCKGRGAGFEPATFQLRTGCSGGCLRIKRVPALLPLSYPRVVPCVYFTAKTPQELQRGQVGMPDHRVSSSRSVSGSPERSGELSPSSPKWNWSGESGSPSPICWSSSPALGKPDQTVRSPLIPVARVSLCRLGQSLKKTAERSLGVGTVETEVHY